MPRRAFVSLCTAVLAFAAIGMASVGAASAADTTFNAHGSVEQVYVTDANPGDELTLVDSTGATAATHQVNSLGGALFRNVTPGDGYRVRDSTGAQSPPLTVLTTQSAPPSTDVYSQTVPSSGYGYLTTRD